VHLVHPPGGARVKQCLFSCHIFCAGDTVIDSSIRDDLLLLPLMMIVYCAVSYIRQN